MAALPLHHGRLTPHAKASIFIVDTRRKVPMKTRVQKWGNSLALRIPKSFAAEAGLHEDAAVELSLAEGRLIVQPLRPARLTLGELLRGVTDDNLHDEWDTGPAVGKEVW
jgi:antitoxin MazE